MPRVKRGTTHVKRRRKLRSLTKGYRFGRKSLMREMSTAIKKAGQHAYADRKKKKRVMRRLWQVKLNAAVRVFDISYSEFIRLLKANKIELDRKVLAEIAEKNPEIFTKIIESLKK